MVSSSLSRMDKAIVSADFSNGRSRNGKSNNGAGNQQKLRGGYYTPAALASALVEWAVSDPHARVLEPSAGDGELVAAAAQYLAAPGEILAVELDTQEAEKIALRGGPLTTVIAGDFFSWFQRCSAPASFDAVVGNPPFIRYQHFPEEQRQAAFDMMRTEGLHPSRLTNAWLPFVVASTRALRPGGRLALVLPAELLQVTYAAELREYLARKYSHLTVITFRDLVFDGILQETVLLLGVREDCSAQISFVELDSLKDLTARRLAEVEEVELDLDHAREKWTQYYLSPAELSLIREIEEADVLGRLGDYAQIDVGIVTGRNEFFVLTRNEAERLAVMDWCLPLIGRSAQVPGIVLRRDEWETLAASNGKCYLLQLGALERGELPDPARAYVEAGEALGFHEGYKCRIRLPRWWDVPSDWEPDAFLLRQIYDGPRIIANHAHVTSTDTIHRVRATAGTDPDWLAATSMNSVTWAFSEIRGRSYGGGVLELEPTEAEHLPYPRPAQLALSVDCLDDWARRKDSEAVLDEVDRQVLMPIGFAASDIHALRGIWRKLSLRRMGRKRR